MALGIPVKATGDLLSADEFNLVVAECDALRLKVDARQGVYSGYTPAASVTWNVAGLKEGKAKITIPTGFTGNIAIALSGVEDGFTGILSVYNQDAAAHDVTLPAGYYVTEGGTAANTVAAGTSTQPGAIELTFAHDGIKTKVTTGKFIAI